MCLAQCVDARVSVLRFDPPILVSMPPIKAGLLSIAAHHKASLTSMLLKNSKVRSSYFSIKVLDRRLLNLLGHYRRPAGLHLEKGRAFPDTLRNRIYFRQEDARAPRRTLGI